MTGPWRPGHMTSAIRAIRESARLVDVLVEVVDARAPASSRDPSLARIVPRPRVVALGKADLADPEVTRLWQEWFLEQGIPAFCVNARLGHGVSELLKGCMLAAGDRTRGRSGGPRRPLRIMVVGVPNVGKSSLINRMTSSGSARTGAAPGVTRGKQWIRAGEGIEVLDLPGVLGVSTGEISEGFILPLLGIIPEASYDPYTVAVNLVRFLSSERPAALRVIGIDPGQAPEATIEAIARRYGYIVKGGGLDVARASSWLLGQARDGKMGRLSLERPG